MQFFWRIYGDVELSHKVPWVYIESKGHISIIPEMAEGVTLKSNTSSGTTFSATTSTIVFRVLFTNKYKMEI
jgi:hypothetical protein